MKDVNDMEEIRELLFGALEKENKTEFRQLNRKIVELREDMRRELNTFSKSIKGIINQLDTHYSDKFKALEEKTDNRFKAHKNITSAEINSMKKEQSIQKEFVSESLDSLRTTFDDKLNEVNTHLIENSVSKASLASMFFESAVKLKNTTLVSEIKNKIKK